MQCNIFEERSWKMYFLTLDSGQRDRSGDGVDRGVWMAGLMALTFSPSSTSGQLDLLIILIIDNLTLDNFLDL